MHIMQIIKHSPESCPLGNPKKLEVMMRWLEQIENIAAKHGIKVLGVWTDRWGHTSWAFFESPNMDAFTMFEVEPENMARVTFNHIETKVVTSAPETLSFFTQYKKLSNET